MVYFYCSRMGNVTDCMFFNTQVRSPERWRALRSSDTPVELCVSSNVLTDSIDDQPPGDVSGSGRTGWVSRARRHHLGLMHAVGHPIAICTGTCILILPTGAI